MCSQAGAVTATAAAPAIHMGPAQRRGSAARPTVPAVQRFRSKVNRGRGPTATPSRNASSPPTVPDRSLR